MKIKLFIITWNNNEAVNACLDSLAASFVPSNILLEITIINNHSNLKLIDKHKHINILNNQTRPDFSTGHLSRNWNQAIISGFKSINNPDCDILITCQNDTVFATNWLLKLIESHHKYSFITAS